MASNSVDLTEEDAADLQFPKECKVKMDLSINSSILELNDVKIKSDFNNKNVNKHICRICKSNSQYCLCYDSNIVSEKTDFNCLYCTGDLTAPYILCAECEDTKLCCFCFSNGAELHSHKNYHKYYVMKNDFILFENSTWTAKEELVMLESLQNYGNWNLVAGALTNRTISEIKDHYNKFYLDRLGSNLFPVIPETRASVFSKPIVPYRFRVYDVEEPPRFSPNTVGYNSLAGYNPPRSDFELEYDSSAERLISNLVYEPFDKDDPYYDVICDLQCAIVRNYITRLKERQRRKRIIREHGLVLIRKTISGLHRYEVLKSMYGFNKPVAEKLLVFMQFMSGIQFDYLMEGMRRAAELKVRISRLSDFRKKGVTSLQGAKLYMKMIQMRNQSHREVKMFRSLPQLNWRSRFQQKIFVPTVKRATFRPLDIVGMPGFETLLPKEQELCSAARLVPELYRELKETLILESKKMGYLKLQTARKILKIDVNKTRKLYDFLVAEGYLVKG